MLALYQILRNRSKKAEWMTDEELDELCEQYRAVVLEYGALHDEAADIGFEVTKFPGLSGSHRSTETALQRGSGERAMDIHAPGLPLFAATLPASAPARNRELLTSDPLGISKGEGVVEAGPSRTKRSPRKATSKQARKNAPRRVRPGHSSDLTDSHGGDGRGETRKTGVRTTGGRKDAVRLHNALRSHESSDYSDRSQSPWEASALSRETAERLDGRAKRVVRPARNTNSPPRHPAAPVSKRLQHTQSAAVFSQSALVGALPSLREAAPSVEAGEREDGASRFSRLSRPNGTAPLSSPLSTAQPQRERMQSGGHAEGDQGLGAGGIHRMKRHNSEGVMTHWMNQATDAPDIWQLPPGRREKLKAGLIAQLSPVASSEPPSSTSPAPTPAGALAASEESAPAPEVAVSESPPAAIPLVSTTSPTVGTEASTPAVIATDSLTQPASGEPSPTTQAIASKQFSFAGGLSLLSEPEAERPTTPKPRPSLANLHNTTPSPPACSPSHINAANMLLTPLHTSQPSPMIEQSDQSELQALLPSYVSQVSAATSDDNGSSASSARSAHSAESGVEERSRISVENALDLLGSKAHPARQPSQSDAQSSANNKQQQTKPAVRLQLDRKRSDLDLLESFSPRHSATESNSSGSVASAAAIASPAKAHRPESASSSALSVMDAVSVLQQLAGPKATTTASSSSLSKASQDNRQRTHPGQASPTAGTASRSPSAASKPAAGVGAPVDVRSALKSLTDMAAHVRQRVNRAAAVAAVKQAKRHDTKRGGGVRHTISAIQEDGTGVEEVEHWDGGDGSNTEYSEVGTVVSQLSASHSTKKLADRSDSPPAPHRHTARIAAITSTSTTSTAAASRTPPATVTSSPVQTRAMYVAEDGSGNSLTARSTTPKSPRVKVRMARPLQRTGGATPTTPSRDAGRGVKPHKPNTDAISAVPSRMLNPRLSSASGASSTLQYSLTDDSEEAQTLPSESRTPAAVSDRKLSGTSGLPPSHPRLSTHSTDSRLRGAPRSSIGESVISFAVSSITDGASTYQQHGTLDREDVPVGDDRRYNRRSSSSSGVGGAVTASDQGAVRTLPVLRETQDSTGAGASGGKVRQRPGEAGDAVTVSARSARTSENRGIQSPLGRRKLVPGVSTTQSTTPARGVVANGPTPQSAGAVSQSGADTDMSVPGYGSSSPGAVSSRSGSSMDESIGSEVEDLFDLTPRHRSPGNRPRQSRDRGRDMRRGDEEEEDGDSDYEPSNEVTAQLPTAVDPRLLLSANAMYTPDLLAGDPRPGSDMRRVIEAPQFDPRAAISESGSLAAHRKQLKENEMKRATSFRQPASSLSPGTSRFKREGMRLGLRISGEGVPEDAPATLHALAHDTSAGDLSTSAGGAALQRRLSDRQQGGQLGEDGAHPSSDDHRGLQASHSKRSGLLVDARG